VRVTYVTGVSGAGKTTMAAELLRRDLPGTRVFDLDEDGRPNVGHVEWLRWRAAEQLHEATEGWPTAPGEPDPAHLVVCGIVWPHAVVDSNAWPAARKAGVSVKFLMLDVPHRVIRERLAERNDHQTDKHFRRLLRYNRDLAAVLRHQVEQQRQGVVIAAKGLTVDEAASWVTDPLCIGGVPVHRVAP
jgi:hypothetical protein